MQRIILFLAFLFICCKLTAQQYSFVHYTPREGLVNNRCRFIYQDSKGKLYIATYGGLSIYDGSRFTNLTTENGLADNLINDVIEMGEDSVWIIPNANKIHYIVKGQLRDFVPTDGFCPGINQLCKNNNGIYYALAEEGLFRLENNRFIKMPMDSIFNGQLIKTFLQGLQIGNRLYILSNPNYKLGCANLLVYDLPTQKLIACNNNGCITSLIKGYDNELWMATVNGIYTPGKIDEQSKTIQLKPLSTNWTIPKNLSVYSGFVDKQNVVWLVTPKGLYRIKNNEAALFTTQNGLITNYQTFVFQDAENNMWFANNQTGVSKLSNQQLAFYPYSEPGYSASDIFIPSSGDSVWLHDIYHHKLVVLFPDGNRKEYENPHEALPNLARFVSGKTNWLTCDKDIYQVQLKADHKHYSLSKFYHDSTATVGFSNALIDRNGNFVAASDKLIVIAGKKILAAPLNYMADQLAIDKDNRIWVVTRKNILYCFEISGTGDNIKLVLLKKFPSIINAAMRSITADRSGNIWIGCRNEGLFCLHFDNIVRHSSRQITALNGLSENFISYLYCDNDDNIWACTPSGLDKIKRVNNNFLVENITRSNNIYFPILKIQQTANGIYWIMSGQGLIRYAPDHSIVNNWKPRILFSEILVNNRQTTNGTKSKFKYFENNLVFHLAAPTYVDERQTRFSYLLEGSGNNSWSQPSSNASINLVNLPAGSYILKAKAIFLHGLYPNTETVFTFTILPPWWQTTWFKLMASILMVSFIFFTIRFYFRRKLQLQIMQIEKKQAIEKERTRIATDMHDDLGAGLSRIKFLSETIGMKKQQHLPIEEEITSIRTYSHDMIDKMGEIVWALNEKNDTLEDLLSYTRSYTMEYLQENGIQCKVKEPDSIPDLNVSGEFRRNIYLTVKETLHNIVKHAQATEVFIVIEINHWLTIKIADNGVGIDNKYLVRTGNGLPSMNTRIQGLKGSFMIENNNGTKVIIKVPLDV